MIKKYTSFSLMIFTFCCPLLHAGSLKKHELSIGVGAWSADYLEKKGSKWLEETIDDKWFGDKADPANNNNGLESRAIKKLGYSYRLQDSLLVTVSGTSQKYKEDNKVGTIRAWLLGGRYEYAASATGCVYSGISIGRATEKYQTLQSSTESSSTVFHVDILGLKYSKDALSTYISIGVGQEGLLQGGLSLGF